MSSKESIIDSDLLARAIIDTLAFPGFDQQLINLLDLSVGRVVRKVRDFSYDNNEVALRHVRDWLKASLVNDERWLKNVDAQGRQKKLMKFSSIEQMVKEADKAMLKAAQKQRNISLAENDEGLVAELDDGYYLVELLTTAALDRESGEMQHCIGNGGYDDMLGSEDVRFLSLRDPFGKPHVTMYLVGSFIEEFQGKQNQFPMRKYIEILKPYLEASCLYLDAPAIRLGYVIDTNCKWHPLGSLPEGLECSSVDVSMTNLEELPKGMVVYGSLDISQSSIKELPEKLRIEGDLIASSSRITKLPSDLVIQGDIHLQHSHITELPDGLVVYGRLNLCFSHIETLPRGLVVKDTLNVSDTMLTELPSDIKVGRTLVLGDCDIECVPSSIGKNIEVINESRRWTVDGFNLAQSVQRSGFSSM
jgi:hypothetical protein